MPNEIKEILDKFDKVLENYELDKKFGQLSIDSIYHLFPNEIITIKDCITNLQEEYEREKQFTKDCGFVNQQQLALAYLDYKSRNEKAIEILKYDMENFDLEDGYSTCDNVLNILEGSDKE